MPPVPPPGATPAGSLRGGSRSAPLLSVVIPTRNTRDLTLACLASLEAVRGEVPGELEIRVVDDGGEDGTAAAIAHRYPAVEVIREPESRGFTAAANRGLEAARGAVLLLLNSDTEVRPGGLAALLAALERAPDLGVVGARLSYPDGHPQWSGGAAPTLSWLFGWATGLPALLARLPLYRSLRPPAGTGGGEVDWVPAAAVALTRAAWRAVGPLDPAFRLYAQDLDLCLRARAAGFAVAVVPVFAVLHHHGATVGQHPSAAGRQRVDLWVADVLAWAHKHRGPGWARRAAAVLRWGLVLRLAGRALHRPLLGRAARGPHDAFTTALHRARREARI